MRTKIYLLALSCLILACQPAEQPDTRAGIDTEASFTADPQPVPEQEVQTLAIGATAPDFNLPGVDGRFYSLADFAEAKALAVVFTCNHCPTAQAYEQRIIDVAADYKDKGVAVVAISPNSPLGLLYEELGYTDLNDDYEEMIIRAEDMNYNFPYLYDGDTEEASLKYGPVATPHIFVFDEDRKLAYTGRVDGIEKPGAANAEDFRAALDAVLAGEPVENPVTKTFGCSTKWGWKTKLKAKTNKEWSGKPVEVAMISQEAIKDLLKNEDSGKLRLINLWATWCGPCIIEYPEFIALHRMYGARDFEFVSISADKPTEEEKVLKFLTEKESAVTNYLFDQEDKYALIEAIDPDWNGALPYTMLIEPGGEIVWKHQGEVDFYELKKVIVEHEMMGRYY